MSEGKRACGTCSLCCKLLGITALDKPADTWCKHCKPGQNGCQIYADRPSACRTFDCGWLSGLREFGDEWFPARCKMVLVPRNPTLSLSDGGIMVAVDPTFPNAWRREPYYSQLLKWAQVITVDVRVRERVIQLSADGTERDRPLIRPTAAERAEIYRELAE